jgi:hypothetical protein
MQPFILVKSYLFSQLPGADHPNPRSTFKVSMSIMGTFSISVSNIDKNRNRNVSIEFSYKVLLENKMLIKF